MKLRLMESDGSRPIPADPEALLRMLNHESWVEQARAMRGVRQMDASVVGDLVRYLQHEDVIVRQGAVKALLQMRWTPGFQDTALGPWLQLTASDILNDLLRSDSSLLDAFLHDADQRFRAKAEALAWPKEARFWHFAATYAEGSGEYDQNFEITGENGSYLGECGMCASTVAGENANHVTALEVWLFDKTDLRTVARMAMSDHTYDTQSLPDKFALKEKAVRAQVGQRLRLSAQSMEMEVKIAEIVYNVDAEEPPHYSFAKVIAELTVFARYSSGRTSSSAASS